MASISANNLNPDVHRKLREIEADATFLWERFLSPAYELCDAEHTVQTIQARALRWSRKMAGGNMDCLAKRLEWDGLNIDEVRPWLGKVRLKDGFRPAPWVEILADIIATATTFDPSSYPFSPINSAEILPFEDVLLPIVACAKRRLLGRYGLSICADGVLPFQRVSLDSYLSLERALLVQLSSMFVDSLHFEFLETLHFGKSVLRALGNYFEDTGSRERYDRFVHKILSDGLVGFFQKYPVLGRLSSTAIKHWAESTALFLDRLNEDHELIGKHFQSFGHSRAGISVAPEAPPAAGRVVAIGAALSDRHHHGRTVIRLSFESGLQVIYKPKELGLEVAFNRLLNWYNSHSGTLTLREVGILDRGEYGWVECIDQKPCMSAGEASDFYERAGMLLCWVYALRGNDCHNENLIACGEHPVLIDLETLFHHDPLILDEGVVFNAHGSSALDQFWDSVIRTGMIPRWVVHPELNIAYDISGLATQSDASMSIKSGWRSINTDDMNWGAVIPYIIFEKNVPIFDKTPLSPNDYQDAIRRGFAETYRFITSNREELLASEGPLSHMLGRKVRHVFRPTRIYGRIHELTWNREVLRNGVDYSIEIDQLAFAFVVSEKKPDVWPVLAAETRAMEELDIPIFFGKTESDALCANEMEPVLRHFKLPSHQHVVQHILSFGDKDLEFQLAIIADSLHGSVARHDVHSENLWAEDRLVSPLPAKLLEAAISIGEELRQRAIEEPDGGANWMGMTYILRANRFQLQMMGDNLYDGRSGIALFLSALYRATGNKEYRSLARRALHQIRKLIRTANPQMRRYLSRSLGLGSAAGLGSIIYSFVRLSEFLDDPEFLSDAKILREWITPELIAADAELDIISGSAGAILGLLALFSVSGEQEALTAAQRCGDHLLKQKTQIQGGFEAWQTIPGKPALAGFSHGAAGIAYALVRLFANTGNPGYLDAALAGIDYERNLFNRSSNNWPDLRGDGGSEDAAPVQWCHGAPGIALARLYSLGSADLPGALSEIDAALETTQSHCLGRLDHVCCGNLGRIDVLLSAARRLGRLELEQLAFSRAGQVLDRANRNGAYALFSNLPVSVYNPGFFQGTSGIGYQFLRMADPSLPSVLAWE